MDDEPKSYQNIPKPRNKSLHHENEEPSGMPYQNIPESRPNVAPRQSSVTGSDASHGQVSVTILVLKLGR